MKFLPSSVFITCSMPVMKIFKSKHYWAKKPIHPICFSLPPSLTPSSLTPSIPPSLTPTLSLTDIQEAKLQGLEPQDSGLVVPLIMQNKPPVVEGREGDELADVELRPEQVTVCVAGSEESTAEGKRYVGAGEKLKV